MACKRTKSCYYGPLISSRILPLPSHKMHCITLFLRYKAQFTTNDTKGDKSHNIHPTRALPFVINTITFSPFSTWALELVWYFFIPCSGLLRFFLIHVLLHNPRHGGFCSWLPSLWTSINCQTSLISNNHVSMNGKKITANLISSFRHRDFLLSMPLGSCRCSLRSNSPVGAGS